MVEGKWSAQCCRRKVYISTLNGRVCGFVESRVRIIVGEYDLLMRVSERVGVSRESVLISVIASRVFS